MDKSILAKKLLSDEIPSKFVWIYDITNGLIPKSKNDAIATILSTEAYKKGFDIRIIRPYEMITMDWQSKRINIQLDNEDNITDIDIG